MLTNKFKISPYEDFALSCPLECKDSLLSGPFMNYEMRYLAGQGTEREDARIVLMKKNQVGTLRLEEFVECS